MNVRITNVSHHTQQKKVFISGKTGYDTITAKNESTFRFTNKLSGEGILHIYFHQAQKKLNTKGLKKSPKAHHTPLLHLCHLKSTAKEQNHTPLERRKAKLNIRRKKIKTKKEEDKNAGGKSTENSKCPKTNEYIKNIM